MQIILLMQVAFFGYIVAIVTAWSVSINETTFIRDKNWSLATINGLVAVLAALMLIEGVIALFRSINFNHLTEHNELH